MEGWNPRAPHRPYVDGRPFDGAPTYQSNAHDSRISIRRAGRARGASLTTHRKPERECRASAWEGRLRLDASRFGQAALQGGDLHASARADSLVWMGGAVRQGPLVDPREMVTSGRCRRVTPRCRCLSLRWPRCSVTPYAPPDRSRHRPRSWARCADQHARGDGGGGRNHGGAPPGLAVRRHPPAAGNPDARHAAHALECRDGRRRGTHRVVRLHRGLSSRRVASRQGPGAAPSP
jgi:hypothetical protein